jgi:hypothetical protein
MNASVAIGDLKSSRDRMERFFAARDPNSPLVRTRGSDLTASYTMRRRATAPRKSQAGATSQQTTFTGLSGQKPSIRLIAASTTKRFDQLRRFIQVPFKQRTRVRVRSMGSSTSYMPRSECVSSCLLYFLTCTTPF